MLKLLKYLTKGERLFMLVSFCFTLTQIYFDLLLIDYMKIITELVQTPDSPQGEIWLAGGKMLLCALGSVFAAFAVCFFAARISSSFAQRLRSNLFNKVNAFSMDEINRFSTAGLITRSTNDITQVRMFLDMAIHLVTRSPVMAVWAVTKIAGKGFEWSVATASAVFVLIIAVILVVIFVVPVFKKMQTLTDNLTLIAREHLTGLRVVRAYNAEDYQDAKFEKANEELTSAQLFTSRTMAILMPLMTLIMSGLSLSVYWIGAYLINAAELSNRLDIFSDMVIFSSYAMRIIMSFMLLVMVFFILPRASVSAKRINEVLDTEPEIVGGGVTESVPDKKGEIVFSNVSFKYPGAEDYILENISFSANRGDTVAIIGSTGSGKSTLINLIPRFFDAETTGEITVSGVNIRDYELETLYNKIGYVPQTAVTFSGSVSSNVAYGDNGKNEYSRDDIENAVRIAEAEEFVVNMDGGYDADISRDGKNISGGQKQRLAIARAICRKPEIYIFDDSFSALDYKTDRALRDSLKRINAAEKSAPDGSPVTCIIVAQRIGTVKDADQIIVLDEGKIAGKGTHKELLKSCEIYREIAASQLSEEELLL